jgi:hypothetical protein
LDAMKKDVSVNKSTWWYMSSHYWAFFMRSRNGALCGGYAFDLEPQPKLLSYWVDYFKISSGGTVGTFLWIPTFRSVCMPPYCNTRLCNIYLTATDTQGILYSITISSVDRVVKSV